MALALALATSLAACAGKHMPAEPPRGASWLTLHQGYFQRHFSVSTSQEGNRQVTRTEMEARQKLLDVRAGDEAQLEWLSPGAFVHREVLETPASNRSERAKALEARGAQKR